MTCGEQPKDIKNQLRSLLIFKREAPKSARPRTFARFAQWLIRSLKRQTCVEKNALGALITCGTTPTTVTEMK